MPTIVHFDLPADDVERAKKFYEKLFDWKFDKVPMPEPYYLIETKDLEESGIGGGMGKRGLPGQQVSIISGSFSREYLEKVEKLGGSIFMPKTLCRAGDILRYALIPRTIHSGCGRRQECEVTFETRTKTNWNELRCDEFVWSSYEFVVNFIPEHGVSDIPWKLIWQN